MTHRGWSPRGGEGWSGQTVLRGNQREGLRAGIPVCLGTGDPKTSILLLSIAGRWRPGHLLRGLGSGGTNGLANVNPFGALNFY